MYSWKKKYENIAFKPVPEWEDYGVSEDGRVFSFKTGKELKQHRRGTGANSIRPSVMLWHDGKGKRYAVHVLVAITYLGPRPSERHGVAHKDGIPWHNHKDNLQWKTQYENIQDKRRHGTHGIKLAKEDVDYIRANYIPHKNGIQLAEEFDISLSTVMNITHHHTWRF